MQDDSKRRVTRRKFLGVSSAAVAGALVGGLVVGGVAGYLGGRTLTPTKETITQNVTTTLTPTTVTSTVTGPTTIQCSTVTTCSTSVSSTGKDRIPPGQYETNRLAPLEIDGTPSFDPNKWMFEVAGYVKNPLKYTWAEFIRLPQQVSISDFHCVTGWTKLNNKWIGVRVKTLIDLAQPEEGSLIGFATFSCQDGYSTSLPLADLQTEDVLLAVKLDDKDLPPENGAPLRLVVPQKYGYKSAKWAVKMEVTKIQEMGYWESLGYSNTADPWSNDRYSKP